MVLSHLLREKKAQNSSKGGRGLSRDCSWEDRGSEKAGGAAHQVARLVARVCSLFIDATERL